MDWVIYIMWQGQGGSSIEEGGDVDVYVTINNRQGGSPGCPSRERNERVQGFPLQSSSWLLGPLR